MALTEEQLKEIALAEWMRCEHFAERGFAFEFAKRLIAALPKSEPVGVFANVNEMIPGAGTRWEHMVDEAYNPDDGYIYLYKESPVAQPASAPSEQMPHFECWSTNKGDSWYEHPADAKLLYDALGNSPKVGDEFEVMAGLCSVQARYRIVSQKDDDFEVECISHPEDSAAPQPDYKAQRDALLEAMKKINKDARLGSSYLALEIANMSSAAIASVKGGA